MGGRNRFGNGGARRSATPGCAISPPGGGPAGRATTAIAAVACWRQSHTHCEDWQHFSETRADLEAAFTAAGIADLLVPTPRGARVSLIE